MVLVLILTGAAAGLAACGSGEQADSASATGASATATPVADYAGAGKGKRLTFIGLFNGSYFNSVSDGAETAAKEAGADYSAATPAAIDGATAISNFQNAVASGTDVAVVSAYPPADWRVPIDQAVKQGVTVGTTDTPSPTSQAALHTGAPRVAMGAAIAKAMAAQLPEDAKGTIVPGLCIPGIQQLLAPVEGLTRELAKLRPGVRVTKPETTAFEPADNYAAWQRIVAKHSDALGFIAVCDPDLISLVKLKQTLHAKWIAGSTAGADSREGLQALETGALVGGISQRGFVQGYVNARLMLEVAAGRKLERGYLNTGYELINKDNAAEYAKALADPVVARKYFGALIDKLIESPDAYTVPKIDADQTDPDLENPER
jgi:ribose transport system substrate-binding protein